MSEKRTTKPAKPKISILGVGRLGSALALGLKTAGYRILAVVARHSSSARTSAKLVGGRGLAVLGAKELEKLPRTDLILIATPDDAIRDVARQLSLLHNLKGVTVLHTSGALSSAVLSPLAAKGVHAGSLHPLVSISDARSGVANLRGAYYCVEGDAVAVKVARKLVRDLGGRSFSISPDKKALYHAAAVMSSGHVVALLDMTMSMLERCGLSRKEAQRILMPLVESTLTNLVASSAEGALTGTFSRGDLRTAQEHMKALTGPQLNRVSTVYRLLAQQSIEIAARRGLDRSMSLKIKRALSGKDDQEG